MSPASRAHPVGRVRIVDVAERAGVSIGTASKALNDTGQLRTETRDRVRQAADELGFAPDQRGRALSQGRTYTVGLVTTDSSGRFSIPIMLGAEDALASGEMALLLCDTRDDPVRERHYLQTLLARRVDGIIVTGRRTEARPPIAAPVPVVYAFSASVDPNDCSVLVDDRNGAIQAVEHLIQLGRTRIAHVTGPAHHRSAIVRAEATRTGAAEHWVGDAMHGSWTETWGRHAVDLLLARHPDLDAISCGSDQIARGVCDRLRDLGRSVPHEVAVTGYDNWEVIAEASRPPLTTVEPGLEHLGRIAGQMLLDAIDGRPHHGVTTIPTRLVTRGSTLSS